MAPLKAPWLNRELLEELRKKKELLTFGRRGRQLKKNTRMLLGHVEGKEEAQLELSRATAVKDNKKGF